MKWMNWLLGRESSASSGFSSWSTAEEVTNGIDASNLTCIVTGANSGLGAETARVLAMRGAQVIMAVRSVSLGEKVKESILSTVRDGRIHVLELDLSSKSSVMKFASEFKSLNVPLNILINNAGVFACPFQFSVDGIELQFATNHIGHFLLTNLLLDDMKKTAAESGIEGRIVIVSSEGHKFAYRGIPFDKLNTKSSYSAFVAYGQSKLANILYARELSKKLMEQGANVTVNALHPGAVPTNIQRHVPYFFHLIIFLKIFLKTIPQGAATQCFVALHPSIKGVSGKYFVNCQEAQPNSYAQDSKLAATLWRISEEMTKKVDN